MRRSSAPRAALRSVLLLGAVSLSADLVYEGSRAILGPYLAALGAGAFAVATVTGFGELLGSALRGFWVYPGATALVAAGSADFPLLAFHLEREGVLGATWIPAGYGPAWFLGSAAMGALYGASVTLAAAFAVALELAAVPLILAVRVPVRRAAHPTTEPGR